MQVLRSHSSRQGGGLVSASARLAGVRRGHCRQTHSLLVSHHFVLTSPHRHWVSGGHTALLYMNVRLLLTVLMLLILSMARTGLQFAVVQNSQRDRIHPRLLSQPGHRVEISQHAENGHPHRTHHEVSLSLAHSLLPTQTRSRTHTLYSVPLCTCNLSVLFVCLYRVLYLAMAPDGQSVVTGAGDESLRFWNLFASKNIAGVYGGGGGGAHGHSALMPSGKDIR